ncbi:MAG: dTDP-4-dehydrorhamnose 3,5-epimerase family protein [Thomasclavelia ramosa]
MKKIETKIPGVVIIEPDIHGDRLSYFMETYSTSNFHELGIDNVLFKTTCLLQQKRDFKRLAFAKLSNGPS